MYKAISCIIPLLAVTACDFGDEQPAGGGCEDTYTVLALDEASVLGFSGQDLLDSVEGEYLDTLHWADGTSENLSITLTHVGGEVRFVDSEPRETEGTTDLAMPYCEDRLEVSVEAAIATNGGSFDEVLTVILNSDDPTSARFDSGDLHPDDLVGSYDFVSFDPSEWDTVDFDITAGFDFNGTEGMINERATVSDDDPDGTSQAAMSNVAAWPYQPE